MAKKKSRAINDFNNPISRETIPMNKQDIYYMLTDWEENKTKMKKDKFIDLIFHGKRGTFIEIFERNFI